MNVNIKILNDLATVPTKGTRWAAGHDLYADIPDGSISIAPHDTRMIGTGIAVEVPATVFGGIFARSGLANREGLRPSNCVGIVDSDYRGEVMVSIHNDSEYMKVINHGDRIAQLIFIPYLLTDLVSVDELSPTDRGTGGFGSTGR